MSNMDDALRVTYVTASACNVSECCHSIGLESSTVIAIIKSVENII